MTPPDELSRLLHGREFESRLRLEEGVREVDGVGVFQERVVGVLRVDIEEDGHVDFVVGVEPLLLEAEALDLVEVLSGFERNDIVRARTETSETLMDGCWLEGMRWLNKDSLGAK